MLQSHKNSANLGSASHEPSSTRTGPRDEAPEKFCLSHVPAESKNFDTDKNLTVKCQTAFSDKQQSEIVYLEMLETSYMFARNKALVFRMLNNSANVKGAELEWLRQLAKHANDQIPRLRSDILFAIYQALRSAETQAECLDNPDNLNTASESYFGGPLSFSEEQSFQNLFCEERSLDSDAEKDMNEEQRSVLIRSDEIWVTRETDFPSR